MNKSFTKNIICIVQARMSSTRLFGKVLLPGYKKPLLLHLIDRLKKSKFMTTVVVATTTNHIDDVIYDMCLKNKIKVYRGHPTNLLNRYYNCAKHYKKSTIVRITSDCPLMDHKIIDNMLLTFNNKKPDFISNIHPPTFPDGYDIEIFKFKALKKAFLNANKDFEREHVTPYIWDNPKKFKILNFFNIKKKNYYNLYRLTLDYKEDYYVIWNIFNKLYPKKKKFELEDVIKYLKKNQNIIKNKPFHKVNWYRHHLNKLKTISRKNTKIIK